MKQLDFGDYVQIEMKWQGVANVMYLHKVIGPLASNGWVDSPVQNPAIETLHDHSEDVVRCICCGVCEREALNYRVVDCKISETKERWEL